MKILVTGGAGFIGSHVVDMLIKLNHKVIVLDNLTTGCSSNLNNEAFFYQCDIRDENVNNILEKEKPQYVIHNAAQISVSNSIKHPKTDAKINIDGTINLLESCIKNNVKKIIYASSAAVYGNPLYLGIDENHPTMPLSFYGVSKLTPEYYIKVYNKLYGLKYTILRYSNVYGPRQSLKGEGGVVSIFVNQAIQSNSSIIFGDGLQSRDFIYVEDVAKANIHSIEYGDNETFNIGSGTQTSINRLYETTCKYFENHLPPTYSPPRTGDIIHSFFNIDKGNKKLGWTPEYNLERGLIKTIEYYSKI